MEIEIYLTPNFKYCNKVTNTKNSFFSDLTIYEIFLFSPLPEDDDDRLKRTKFEASRLTENPITRQTISLPAAERLIGSSATAGTVVTAR